MLARAQTALPRNLWGRALNCALQLGFFFLLRVSELVGGNSPKLGLRVRDVTLYKNGELLSRPSFLEADEAQLVVRGSKTDPEGETATGNLFRSGAEVCPVAAATEYLELLWKEREPLPGEMFLAHIHSTRHTGRAANNSSFTWRKTPRPTHHTPCALEGRQRCGQEALTPTFYVRGGDGIRMHFWPTCGLPGRHRLLRRRAWPWGYDTGQRLSQQISLQLHRLFTLVVSRFATDTPFCGGVLSQRGEVAQSAKPRTSCFARKKSVSRRECETNYFFVTFYLLAFWALLLGFPGS